MKIKRFIFKCFNCLKTVFDKIKNFLKNNWKTLLFILLLVFGMEFCFLTGYFYGNEDKQLINESQNYDISLTSAIQGAGSSDYFDETSSDYVVLNCPLFISGDIKYRSVGSLFIGYNGNNYNGSVYLSYPTLSENGYTIQYSENLINVNSVNYIDIACVNVDNSDDVKNINVAYSVNVGTALISHQVIYYCDKYNNFVFMDKGSNYISYLSGYTTVNKYTAFYRVDEGELKRGFDIELYNANSLSTKISDFELINNYLPCLHFNDHSGYVLGFEDGYNKAYDYGYNWGYENGFSKGYDDGYLNVNSPFDIIVDGFNSLLNINLFGDFSLGDAFSLGITIVLFGILMKCFRF